ncbi:MAG: LysM peptidoglycan-binding domain-containing protein, partial [Comamonadaceae bacterium]
GQYASWTAWTVPSTMTVADAAQRSGMSEVDLRAINNIPPRMLIKTGSTLIVPRSAKVQEDVAALVADTGHLSFQPEIVTRRTTVKAGRNDSVASIARRYRVSAANVAEWNDVKATHAFPRGYGVVVYLPVRAARAAAVGTGARGSAAVVKATRGGGVVRASAVNAKAPAKSTSRTSARASSRDVAKTARGGSPAKKKR